MMINSHNDDTSSGEDDDDDINQRNPEEGPKIDFREKVKDGSFLPAMVLLELDEIHIEDVIDPNQGLRLLHFACYFGKLKAIKTICEQY